MVARIRGVHHVIFTVSDVARLTHFYEQVLGTPAFSGDERVRCISGGSFLLCLQRPPTHAFPDDRFDENRIGLDHIGFAVESRTQLEELLIVLADLAISTAGIKFDPDGAGEYVCFRDPDNIQVE